MGKTGAGAGVAVVAMLRKSDFFQVFVVLNKLCNFVRSFIFYFIITTKHLIVMAKKADSNNEGGNNLSKFGRRLRFLFPYRNEEYFNNGGYFAGLLADLQGQCNWHITSGLMRGTPRYRKRNGAPDSDLQLSDGGAVTKITYIKEVDGTNHWRGVRSVAIALKWCKVLNSVIEEKPFWLAQGMGWNSKSYFWDVIEEDDDNSLLGAVDTALRNYKSEYDSIREYLDIIRGGGMPQVGEFSFLFYNKVDAGNREIINLNFDPTRFGFYPKVNVAPTKEQIVRLRAASAAKNCCMLFEGVDDLTKNLVLSVRYRTESEISRKNNCLVFYEKDNPTDDYEAAMPSSQVGFKVAVMEAVNFFNGKD